MRKAFLRAAVALVALLVVGALALTAVVSFKVLFPTAGSDRHADVIVSLAPGYNRLPTALELYNAGQGDELAVTWIPTEITPTDAGYEFVQLEEQTCREVTDPHLHC